MEHSLSSTLCLSLAERFKETNVMQKCKREYDAFLKRSNDGFIALSLSCLFFLKFSFVCD